jgi:hypothetical protein
LTHKFAKKGRYVSAEENGEDMVSHPTHLVMRNELQSKQEEKEEREETG